MNKSKVWTASEMGKKSAQVRKERGHDSEYYRKMVQKRWATKRTIACTQIEKDAPE